METEIPSERLDVVFQPIRELATGRVLGFEVLGRLRTDAGEPARGPVELIEQAVQSGRLFELERGWRSVAIARIAQLAGDRDEFFFINVDTRILKDPRFRPGTTRDLLAAHGLAPGRIVFELCERDPALGAARLAELLPHYVDQGFGIALDDLGMGHSSLHALLQLRPQWIKLGGELVRGVGGDPMRRHLIHALVLFALLADVNLIAEGIETLEDVEALLELGVRYGQGYLLGRPQTTPDVPPASWLAMDSSRYAARREHSSLRPPTAHVDSEIYEGEHEAATCALD